VTVQYKVLVGKKDERTDGPGDADIVFTAPVEIAGADGFDATVEFMRGKVKAAGHSGHVLDVLKSGAATTSLASLASQA